MKTKMSNDYETETETEMSPTPAIISVGEENSGFSNLSANLAEVRKFKGVIGYILRNDSSAIVDLNDSNKIIEYATLSSEVNDSCFETAKLFNLGDCKRILVESENMQVLCINLGENRISLFLEKTTDSISITESFCPKLN